MAISQSDLQELVKRPSESLSVEHKQWIDPSSLEGKAKIARACISLRNIDGGHLIIGIKNDGSYDPNVPLNVAGIFHHDVIQGIVSKHSSDPFAINVTFVENGGVSYPVISVPSGVRTPVTARNELRTDDKVLLRPNAVYVRTLTANNTVSSAEASGRDWDELIRICFNNREADIGGFVRRHLAALDLNSLAALIPSVSRMLNQPTRTEQILAELNSGRSRFDFRCKEIELSPPKIGYRESVAIIDGKIPEQLPDADFRDRLLRRVPFYSGWPPFVYLHESGNQSDHPYVRGTGWEMLYTSLPPERPVINSYHIDFWRIDVGGVFYHSCGLQDDLTNHIGLRPLEQLDIWFQITRTAEIILSCLYFARSMGCIESETSLIFGFRWTKLKGRHLTSWANPRMRPRQIFSTAEDEYTSPPIIVPLETPPQSVWPHVENAVKGLFNVFGGMRFSSDLYESFVSEILRLRVH
jgi:hypothetical protein